MVLILTVSPLHNDKSVTDIHFSFFPPIKNKEVDQEKLIVIFHETHSSNNSHYWHIVSGHHTLPPLPPTFLQSTT